MEVKSLQDDVLTALILTWGSQYSWYRKLFWWNQTSWTESDSIPHRVSLAWCRWMAWHEWLTDSWRLWNDDGRSCHRVPALRKWNTSSTICKQNRRVRPMSRWQQPLTFLIIMTRKGSLIARVLLLSTGQVMKLVETLVPMISRTDDWISASVSLLMWPFLTCLSQIWSGLDLYTITG